MNIPEPQPPEILRLVLGSLHCDSDRSLDNILRKHVLVNFSHFTKRMWRHREVKEAAVSFILEEFGSILFFAMFFQSGWQAEN